MLHWIVSVHLTALTPYCRQGKGHIPPLQFFLLGKSEPESAFDMKNKDPCAFLSLFQQPGLETPSKFILLHQTSTFIFHSESWNSSNLLFNFPGNCMEENRVFPGIDMQSNNWTSWWAISKYHQSLPPQDIFSSVLPQNPAHSQLLLHSPICSPQVPEYLITTLVRPIGLLQVFCSSTGTQGP